MIRKATLLVLALALVTTVVPLIGGASGGPSPVAIGRVHSSYQPSRGKIFILVIGNDARAGNPDRSRADAIHIVGINTKTMRGGILNFPRDSWVSVPGHGFAKINEALYAGGPRLLASTLEGLTGIRLDYWVMTGFQGFRGIMRRLDGVRFRLAREIHDQGGSGANLRAGKQTFDAEEALAYVRTRKAFSGGDVARTTNQGRFLLALLRKLRREVEQNPAAVLKWSAAARQHARFDLSPEEIFRLGVLATQVRPGRVGNVTVPVSIGSVGAASVVFISPQAASIYGRFRSRASL
jgi:polyisoprenyl-teichoic acid--peptidoglycan teichoic acid transferase